MELTTDQQLDYQKTLAVLRDKFKVESIEDAVQTAFQISFTYTWTWKGTTSTTIREMRGAIFWEGRDFLIVGTYKDGKHINDINISYDHIKDELNIIFSNGHRQLIYPNTSAANSKVQLIIDSQRAALVIRFRESVRLTRPNNHHIRKGSFITNGSG